MKPSWTRVWGCFGIAALAFNATVTPLCACDPDHQWELVRTLTRRVLTPGAAGAVVRDLGMLKRALGGGKVAILAVEDRYAQEGTSPDGIRLLTDSERAAVERMAARVLADALTHQDLPVVGHEDVERVLVAAKVPRDLWESPLATKVLSERLGARLFVRVALMEYGQTVTVTRDARASNVGLMEARTFDFARARLAVQDVDGAHVILREVMGQSSDGALFFAKGQSTGGGAGGIDRFVEYKVTRPGAAPIQFPTVLRHLDS